MAVRVGRLIVVLFALLTRVLTWPIRKRRERTNWLNDASGPESPINSVPGLSDDAKRVYAYLASVILRFGQAHSRIGTIAKVARLSERGANEAIRELEQGGLLSRRPRFTRNGRAADAYYVRGIRRETDRETEPRVEQPIRRYSPLPMARDGNPHGPLYGEVMVFTGELSIPRDEAADAASAAGCKVAANVTKQTTLLVVGNQDVSKLAGYETSSKQRKAEELIRRGQKIRIIREAEFHRIVEQSRSRASELGLDAREAGCKSK
ncbi:MAG: BRCT domain-containing protein [Candidatus Binatales bacterium]